MINLQISSHWGILVEGVWERTRHGGQSTATRTSRHPYHRDHGSIDVAGDFVGRKGGEQRDARRGEARIARGVDDPPRDWEEKLGNYRDSAKTRLGWRWTDTSTRRP